MPKARSGDPFSADELLTRAKAGDREARNALLRDFTPFILRAASQAAGRYLTQGRDEEISIALLAFNEAIDAFQPDKGRFLSFAETVIKRRLIDYFRRRQREMSREVVMSDLAREDDEDDGYVPALDAAAEQSHAVRTEEDDRRREIEDYRMALAEWGLTWNQLVRLAPKHRDARSRAISMARMVAGDLALRESFLTKKELPVKLLVQKAGFNRKLVERNRTYMIAIILILLGDYPYLQGYVLG